MSGLWDDSLKMFISENPQDFASWLFEGAIVVGKLLTEFKTRTLEADSLLEVFKDGERFLLHIEFQSTNVPFIGERLLAYNFEARREHKLPVYSCVIYLRSEGEVPVPKLVRVTKGLATITDDPEVLQRLIVKMGTAQSQEEAQQHLLEVDGNEKKG